MVQPTFHSTRVSQDRLTTSSDHITGLLMIALVLAAVPGSPARAQQNTPSPEAIGKAIDAQLDRIRSAVAAGEEGKLNGYLAELYPALAKQKDAKTQPYVDAARGSQARNTNQGALWSLMETCGYSGYVSDGLNLMTLGNIGMIDSTLDGTLNNLGNIGLVLCVYDVYDKASRGQLDDNTRTAAMLAVYAKIASHYLKRYGNAFGAAAMTGYNLGMWARKWQLSSSQQTLLEGMDRYWRDRAKTLNKWTAMWTDMWDRGGHAEVMKQLKQAGFWSEVDATKIYTGWSLQTWQANYKAILGQKYFEKYVAKILANHVRNIAEDERVEVIDRLHRFMRDFPKRELTFVTSLSVVNDGGGRAPVDVSRVLVGLYCNKQKVLDLPMSTQQVSAKVNLLAFSKTVAEVKGDFQVCAFYRCRNDSPRVAPAALPSADWDVKTGLSRAFSDPWAFCFWSRLRFTSQGMAGDRFRVGRGGDRLNGFGTFAWLGPIQFNFYTLPAQFRVVGPTGQPVGEVTLAGPCGSAKTDPQGKVQLMVTTSSQTLISVKRNGQSTGDWILLDPAEVFQDPQAVHTIKLSENPPLPKLGQYGATQAKQHADSAMASFKAGKKNFGPASKQLQQSGRLAQSARTNAQNTWGAYEVVQLARINRRYAPKPNMSADALAAAARQARKQREQLAAQREQYLQPFEQLATQQKQASNKLATQAMQRNTSIRRTMADGKAAGQALRERIIQTRKRMKRLDSLVTMSAIAARPREFQTLAELQAYRTSVQKQRAEVDALGSDLKTDRTKIDTQLTAFTNTLGSMVDPLEKALGLADVWDFQARMGALLTSGQNTLRDLEGDLDSDKPTMVAASYRLADELLGGVQIQVAKDQQLMKEYDALLASPPMRLRNEKRRARNLQALAAAFKEIDQAIALAKTRGRWSYHLQIPSNEEKQAWGQAGHNGFGVGAYEPWLEAERIWKRLATIRQILQQAQAVEDWFKQVEAKRNAIASRRAAMKKSGWWIAEIDQALARREPMPKEVRTLAGLLKQARQVQTDRQGYAKLLAASVLHGAITNFDFDRLLAASREYGKQMARAVDAAGKGDRAKALAARQAAEQAIAPFTYQRSIGFDVGQRYATATLHTDWELVASAKALGDRDTLAGLLAKLQADNRARLTIEVRAPQGVDISQLVVRLRDDRGKEPPATVSGSPATGLVYLLDPQAVTVEAAMPGAKVTPATSNLTLRAQGKQSLTLRIEPTLGGKTGSGTGSGGTGSGGGHTQKPGTVEDMAINATMLCKVTFDDAQPPRWTADSRVILLPNFQRVTLTNGRMARLGVSSAVNPHILGDQVVYRTNVGGDWLMTTPLAGGQGSRLCRTRRRSPTNRIIMTLLDVRDGASPLLLFLRHVPAGWQGRTQAQTGLWVVPGPIPNVDKGQWIGMLPDGSHDVIVSDNWLRVAVPTWKPGQRRSPDWTIYHTPQAEQPCRPIARIDASAGVRALDFSPNGAYVITVQTNRGESFQTLAVRPVDSPGTQTIVARGATTYGRPGWSRDGRFVALRAFGQPSSGASQLMILQIAGQDYSFSTGKLDVLACTGQGGSGQNAGDHGSDHRGDTDDHEPPPPKTSDELKQAEADVKDAYNRLTSLMAAGKGDTPEAQQAYKEYKKARDRYEKLYKGQ